MELLELEQPELQGQRESRGLLGILVQQERQVRLALLDLLARQDP